MRLYIPTFDRVDRQDTYKNLPKSLREEAVLVVYPAEDDAYGDIPVVVVPPEVKGVAMKRQWIIDQHKVKKYGPHIVMLDDDLGWAVRKPDDPSHFRPPTEKDIIKLFSVISKRLAEGYPQVGVIPREGGHNMDVNSGLLECTRVMRMSGYNVEFLRANDIRFDRVVFMEDFDVTLQILRKGVKNCVLTEWCQGQGDSNAKGGCSSYRGIKDHNEAAERLAALHPGYVKVVEKQTKNAWGGETRKDVIVSWQKAYLEARNGV
jgi:hypothetical protein